MSMISPLISVVVPCFNEYHYIAVCLDSILSNDFDHDQLEILIIDGQSNDGTLDIIKEYQKKCPFIKLMDNPRRTPQFAFNLGIKSAAGKYIVRLDAHSALSPSFFKEAIGYLETSNADCVGGALETRPQNKTVVGNSIAFVMEHLFGVGPGFRTFRNKHEQPFEIHTVAFGCYRRSVYERIGYYNERLSYSEDIEFHSRMEKAGMKTIFNPKLRTYYFSRSTFYSFIKHSYRNGVWAILPILYTNTIPVKIKHLVPLFFVSTFFLLSALAFFMPIFYGILLSSFLLYFGIGIMISLFYSIQERNIVYIVTIPVSFSILHFGYGIGSCVGVLKILISRLSVIGSSEASLAN